MGTRGDEGRVAVGSGWGSRMVEGRGAPLAKELRAPLPLGGRGGAFGKRRCRTVGPGCRERLVLVGCAGFDR